MNIVLRILLSQTPFAWGDPMAYQWDSSLETGYEKVDKQHKQLVAAVNNLMEASASGRGDAAV